MRPGVVLRIGIRQFARVTASVKHALTVAAHDLEIDLFVDLALFEQPLELAAQYAMYDGRRYN